MVPVLEVVAAVILRDGTALACRRLPTLEENGKWEFPGGKIEDGESPEDALVREIKEELSVDVVVERHLVTSDTDRGSRVIRLMCFIARLAGDEPTQSTDHDALRWVPLTELDTLAWAPADLDAVHRLMDSSST